MNNPMQSIRKNARCDAYIGNISGPARVILREEKMQAVKRIPVVQQVVNSLKEFITSGDVAVGEKLPSEMELCERLSVGRGTVREAIRVLQATGYVELRPGRGAFVARTEEAPDSSSLSGWFSENEMELMDYMQVRTAVEPLAIRLAIEKCRPEDIEVLEKNYRDTQEAVEKNDAALLGLYDEQFHAYIFECSNNQLLISINKTLVDALKKFRSRTFFIPSNAHNVLEPHGLILQAFRDRDAAAGERHMLEHIDRIVKDLEKSKES